MKLKIKYYTDFEIYRTKQVLPKLDFYLSQGCNPKLPKEITTKSSKKEIKTQIKKEFDKASSKKVEEKIEKEFYKIRKDFETATYKYFKKTIENITLYLTKYGPANSYRAPNEVVFMIHNKRILGVLVHEIIHLFIDNQIKKHKISKY